MAKKMKEGPQYTRTTLSINDIKRLVHGRVKVTKETEVYLYHGELDDTEKIKLVQGRDILLITSKSYDKR